MSNVIYLIHLCIVLIMAAQGALGSLQNENPIYFIANEPINSK